MAFLCVAFGKFFQFMQNARVSEDLLEIDLVSFSLNNLAQCKINTNALKNFKANLQRKGGVLKREDFDAGEYRRLKEKFDDLNPTILFRDSEIHITNYKFEKLGDQDWQIVEIVGKLLVNCQQIVGKILAYFG